ncbi:MAG TPA: hypothetical protein VFZ58_05185 [Candidatus Saccharimonadales bacterium]
MVDKKVLVLGMIIGGFLGGLIASWFGAKPLDVISVILAVIGAIAGVFVVYKFHQMNQ